MMLPSLAVTSVVLSVVAGTVGSPTAALAPIATKISGTMGTLVGGVTALLEGNCNAQYSRCTVTVSGEIENMLGDGGNYTGLASISAWMQNGHGYGSLKLAGTSPAPLPYNITCNTVANVCVGTLSGNVTQLFVNGQQIMLWGWLTPSGYCASGSCYGSITALGDPGY